MEVEFLPVAGFLSKWLSNFLGNEQISRELKSFTFELVGLQPEFTELLATNACCYGIKTDGGDKLGASKPRIATEKLQCTFTCTPRVWTCHGLEKISCRV